MGQVVELLVEMAVVVVEMVVGSGNDTCGMNANPNSAIVPAASQLHRNCIVGRDPVLLEIRIFMHHLLNHRNYPLQLKVRTLRATRLEHLIIPWIRRRKRD